jgi:hypothetical protein
MPHEEETWNWKYRRSYVELPFYELRRIRSWTEVEMPCCYGRKASQASRIHFQSSGNQLMPHDEETWNWKYRRSYAELP